MKQIIGTITLAVILLSGCVKSTPDGRPNSKSGVLQVNTNWSGLSTDAEQPKTYLLRINEMTNTVGDIDNAFRPLLTEGTYTLLVQNIPNGITVGRTTATVNTLADRTLEPMPDYLFSAMEEVKIIKGNTLKVSVKMLQSIRTLNLRLKLKDGDQLRIASTEATLDGIASTISLATGVSDKGSAGKIVRPSFRIETVSPTAVETTPALVTTVRLAGVTTTGKQLLKLFITLKGGETQIIETDISELLKNFADDIEPLTLESTLKLADDKDADVSGIISDWNEVQNGDFPIH